MLAELFLSAITPAGRVARRMGLVAASIGLWSRGGRRRRLWEPHHARCRAVVRRAVEGLGQRRTVVVLGSGLMRDVELDHLSGRFRRVLLVDAVHLPMVRLAARRHSNVRLLERDLTGLQSWFEGGPPARVPPLTDLVEDREVDLVISANCASQLPLGVEEFMDSRAARGLALPEDLPARSVAWHFDDLAGFPCRVCLITDTVMLERDRAGRTTDELDLLRGHSLPDPDETWSWTVAPFGEVERDHEFVHTVCAWSMWRQKTGGR